MAAPRMLLVLALLAPLAAAQAQVYKWVDENGQVHYGRQAPPSRPAETVDVPKAAPPGDSLEALRARSEAADERRQQAREAAAQARERAERERELRETCAKMRANLDLLQTRNRIRELRNGEYVALTPQEQQARVEKLQGQIEEHCQDL